MAVIGICTSADSTNVDAFMQALMAIHSFIKFVQLPYNDLDSFKLMGDKVDGIILCHSINNRRFAMTDVMDALYDRFLPHAKGILGKDNIAVIVHDFPWPSSSTDHHHQSKEDQLDAFRIRQPTTFKCSSLTIICGKLDTVIQMDKEDWSQLAQFLDQVKPPIISTPINNRQDGVMTFVLMVYTTVMTTLSMVYTAVMTTLSMVYTAVKITASMVYTAVKITASMVYTAVKITASMVYTTEKMPVYMVYTTVMTTLSVVYTTVKMPVYTVYTIVRAVTYMVYTCLPGVQHSKFVVSMSGCTSVPLIEKFGNGIYTSILRVLLAVKRDIIEMVCSDHSLSHKAFFLFLKLPIHEAFTLGKWIFGLAVPFWPVNRLTPQVVKDD